MPISGFIRALMTDAPHKKDLNYSASDGYYDRKVSFVQTKISPRQVPVYFAAQMHVNREPSRWIRCLERTLSLISLFSY